MLSDIERKKREAAHFFVERLNERARDLILKVILFGSVARGEAREESDIAVSYTHLTLPTKRIV